MGKFAPNAVFFFIRNPTLRIFIDKIIVDFLCNKISEHISCFNFKLMSDINRRNFFIVHTKAIVGNNSVNILYFTIVFLNHRFSLQTEKNTLGSCKRIVDKKDF